MENNEIPTETTPVSTWTNLKTQARKLPLKKIAIVVAATAAAAIVISGSKELFEQKIEENRQIEEQEILDGLVDPDPIND